MRLQRSNSGSVVYGLEFGPRLVNEFGMRTSAVWALSPDFFNHWSVASAKKTAMIMLGL